MFSINALILTISAILLSHTSLAAEESTTSTLAGLLEENDDRQAGPPPIRPFDHEMLPRSQVGGQYLPGLGQLMILNTSLPPKAADAMETTFCIHTRDKTTHSIRFQGGDCKLSQCDRYQYDVKRMAQSGFDPNKRTVVLIPGYLSPDDVPWVREAKTGWLELHGTEVNVITLSWSDSNRGLYPQAVAHTTIVARQLTIFLHYLYEVSGASIQQQWTLDKLHLVGHSLGAHIAGFVGQDLGGRVGRITGLDPAGPAFDEFPPGQRLDRTDAQLVEVLHTNSGKLGYLKSLARIPLKAISSWWPGSRGNNEDSSFITSGLRTNDQNSKGQTWFGIIAQSGHIDLYANDGSEQPGCSKPISMKDRIVDHICDHNRATAIYVDLLRYEILLKSSVKDHKMRLMAYKAVNYESFETGESFALECDDLLNIRHHLDKGRQEKIEPSCAVPLLDFVKPTLELIDELKSKYKVDFESDTNSGLQPRYYFKTSAGTLMDKSRNELVGEHHLLRIYLADQSELRDRDEYFRWSEPHLGKKNWCSLRIQMNMPTGEAYMMELGYVRPKEVALDSSGAKLWMLAIPYVHPSGSEVRMQLEQLLAMVNKERLHRELNDRMASAEFTNTFKPLLPRSIVLSVSENKPSPASEQPVCLLNVKALEMGPLDGRIGALFGFTHAQRLALGEPLPLITSDDLVEQLAPRYRESSLPSSIRLSTGSGGDFESIRSFTVGLEAALVDY